LQGSNVEVGTLVKDNGLFGLNFGERGRKLSSCGWKLNLWDEQLGRFGKDVREVEDKAAIGS